MTALLNISRGLQLPLTSVTGTFGLLAVRGAGKTNAARALAEEMFEAHLPFVAIDPVGSWHGLRAGKDGKAEGGLPIAIFGGDHGDAPLTRGSGEIIADLVVSERLSCVLDLSGFDSEADKKYFLLQFARRLYQKNRDPLHLFLEEADDYIPQKPMKDELQLMRAWENIVRRGRGRGIGMTLITQRSAVVNKDVLTQVETLFVMRTTGPQDIKAIEGWTKYHDFGHDLLSELSGLEDGESYVWLPHFLKTNKRFKFRLSHTFDSGATPKNLRGKDARKRATLIDIDIDKLKVKLEATVEKVKGEDPKALRTEVSFLKRELATQDIELKKLRAELAKAKPPVDLKQLNSLIDKLSVASQKTEESVRALLKAGFKVETPEASATSRRLAAPDAQLAPAKQKAKLRTTPYKGPPDSGTKLQACPRALLNVLAAKHPDPVTAPQLSIMSGYSLKSSGFNNALSTLRKGGYIVGGRVDLVVTEFGLHAAGTVTPIPTGRESLEYWKGKLDKCPATMLQVIYDAGVLPGGSALGGAVSKEYIAEHSGYSMSSSGFNNGLSTLRTLKLIEGYGEMKAADSFYD